MFRGGKIRLAGIRCERLVSEAGDDEETLLRSIIDEICAF
jgi:hypothetical protein